MDAEKGAHISLIRPSRSVMILTSEVLKDVRKFSLSVIRTERANRTTHIGTICARVQLDNCTDSSNSFHTDRREKVGYILEENGNRRRD